MKKFTILTTLSVFIFSILAPVANAGYVRGYTRKNGTYVSGHYRSSPKTYRSSSSYNHYANSNSHYVNGYYRKDGTYVNGYNRTNPDGIEHNNYSYNNPYHNYTTPLYTSPNYNNSDLDNSIRNKKIEVETKRQKYEAIKKEWDEIEEKINNNTRYSGISASGKRTMIEDQRKHLRYSLSTAMDEYNNTNQELSNLRGLRTFDENNYAIKEYLQQPTQPTQPTSYNYEWEKSKQEAEKIIQERKTTPQPVVQQPVVQQVVTPTKVTLSGMSLIENMDIGTFGEYNEKVKNLQDFLKAYGTYKGNMDGIMTIEVLGALRSYQVKNKIPQTGFVDKKTQEKIKKDLNM